MKPKQVALIILDGWGHREDTKDNGIAEAKTPFFDSLLAKYPHAVLDASGEDVGLPEGQIGNSEIGHMTIGAGKVIDTDLVRITKAMNRGEFITNPQIRGLFEHVQKNNSTLHLLGLLSPGGIHSHHAHLHGLLKAAKEFGIEKVAIHAFTDGRDTPPQSAHASFRELEDLLAELGIGFIATASGRFYAMDRDNNWDRLEKAEKAICEGSGNICKTGKPSEILNKLYKNGVLDEHLEPHVFLDENGSAYTLKESDGALYFNFRPDRARQLTKKVLEYSKTRNIKFVTLTQYEKHLGEHAAFLPGSIETTLANELSNAGFTQAHIAETEKYAHATYFLNGGRETPHKGEEHILVESRKDITTHDQAPEMRAKEITDKAIEQIEKDTNFIFINYANADMVGHTANKEAIIIAVETIDRELKRFIEALTAKGGIALITADHGNAELNVDQDTHEKHTAHTLNRVPVILTKENVTLINGTLADVAPTMLSLFDLPVPNTMTGKVLYD
jgi:2,3-bisphosphoglycerate-independent phosphoglycerate mutase